MDRSGEEKAWNRMIKLTCQFNRNQTRLASFLVLVICSFIFWQWRYVRVSPNLVRADACQNPEAWIGQKSEPWIKFTNDGVVITKEKHSPVQSIHIPLGDLSTARYLSVKCDAAWENCYRDLRIMWSLPRISVTGHDDAGRFTAPLDHSPVDAIGTKLWHREHAILELPANFKNARISLEGFGVSGVLKVNNLQVEIVRLREWTNEVGLILLSSWVLLVGYCVHPYLKGRWKVVRSAGLGAAICAAFAIFVFPQPRSLERPLVEQFWLGPILFPSPTLIEPAQQRPNILPKESNAIDSPLPQNNAERQPRIRTLPATPPPPAQEAALSQEAELPATPKIRPAEPQPQVVISSPSFMERHVTSIRTFVRTLDHKWNLRTYNLTHFTSFFAIGLTALLLARRDLILLPLAIMAVLSEIVPDLIHNIGDDGDFYDVVANLCGLIVAYFVYFITKKFFYWMRKLFVANQKPNTL